MYPGKGAEDLLKSASDRFEKSKRIHIYENSMKPNEEGIQEVNRGFNLNPTPLVPSLRIFLFLYLFIGIFPLIFKSVLGFEFKTFYILTIPFTI